MGTALAIYEKVENPIAFCESFAESVAATVGCSLTQGRAVALACLCEGLNPIEFKRRYHWIPTVGPTMRADAMRSEFRTNYGGKYEVIEWTSEKASIRFTDQYGGEILSEITWEDAQQEFWPWAKGCGPGTKNTQPKIENLKDNWATPIGRRNMLMARATTAGMKLICPELVAGIYTPEEMQDLDVVSTTITTNGEQPKRKTAAEAMAAQAAAATTPAIEQQQTQPETAPFEQLADGEVVDAEFEVVAEQPRGEGFATAAQIEKLNELRDELKPPQDKWDKILADRGATTLHGLKKEDAQELIDKLNARRKPEKN